MSKRTTAGKGSPKATARARSTSKKGTSRKGKTRRTRAPASKAVKSKAPAPKAAKSKTAKSKAAKTKSAKAGPVKKKAVRAKNAAKKKTAVKKTKPGKSGTKKSIIKKTKSGRAAPKKAAPRKKTSKSLKAAKAVKAKKAPPKKTSKKTPARPKKSARSGTASVTITRAKTGAGTKSATKRSVKKRRTRAPSSGKREIPAVRPPFDPYKGSKSYIFTSYSHRNMDEVFKTIDMLNQSRFRIWYDEGIEPGFEWPEVVGKAVLGCSQFLVFMSPSATKSRNVRNEINLAFSENKDILVIFLEKTKLSEGMRLQIGTVQFINKYEMTEDECMEKLKKVLNSDLRN